MESVKLKCNLPKGMTEQERLKAIRSIYQEYGEEFYYLCQVQKDIEESVKDRLSEKVCTEYVRQRIFPTLKCFASGQFGFGELNKKDCKMFAKAIKDFSDEAYQELLNQIDNFENHFDKQIEKAKEGKGGK